MATPRSFGTTAFNARLLRGLTCLMFFMFAMTSDAVGSIIPLLIKQFNLSMSAASAFHYVPMAAIAAGAIFLGLLADRLGRKWTVVAGLVLYGLSAFLFALSNAFGVFVVLLGALGLGISVFKIGALALIGDITTSNRQHTSFMNTVEGFFGLGAIVGPAIVGALITAGLSWKWLYLIAGGMCVVLIAGTLSVRFPQPQGAGGEAVDLRRTIRMMKDPYAIGFSLLIMLYVSVEVAIYVWMPTYLEDYRGPMTWLPTFALSIFFVLRAAGRFLGAWLLRHFSWTSMLGLFAIAIFLCFAGSLFFGVTAGAVLLPLSGLFMSMIYPTLNSKGISCFPRSAHGAVAGVILFFTALAAALSPLAMAVISDAYGNARYGFGLAAVFSGFLLVGLLYNWAANPARRRLEQRDAEEYGCAEQATSV